MNETNKKSKQPDQKLDAFVEEIGNIDPKYVEEARQAFTEKSSRKTARFSRIRKRSVFFAAPAAAACLLLFLTIGVLNDGPFSSIKNAFLGSEKSVSNHESDINNEKKLASGHTQKTIDLMADFQSSAAGKSEHINGSKTTNPNFSKTVMDFATQLFQQTASTDSGKNVMISPLSVFTALSMTANGAKGETLHEILQTIAPGYSLEELNQHTHQLLSKLPSSETAKLLQANSIWFQNDKNQFQANPDFLQINADYYQADLYSAPFDKQTLSDINHWVSEHTNQMIPKMLSEIPTDAVMYLINALAFEASWASPYQTYDVQDCEFTNLDRSVSTVSMMHSQESSYLKMEHAEGFLKPYSESYAFAAFLPDEEISLETFIKELTSEALFETLSHPLEETTEVLLPKFTSEYSTELSDSLINMGMTLPFDLKQADFSSLSANQDPQNLAISRILHKTYISVEEKGTRAAAATAVEIEKECLVEASHHVELTRPFVYMILDQNTKLPIFIGMVTNLNQN